MDKTIRDILIKADSECCSWCKVCGENHMCFNCINHKERITVIQGLEAHDILHSNNSTIVKKEEPFVLEGIFGTEKGVKNDGMGDTASDSGSMKQRWDLLPIECIEKIVEVYTFGAKKYGDNTWQKVDPDRYYAALFRHIKDWRKGEIYDEESDLMHIAHAGWNVLTLIWHEIQKEKKQEKVDFL